MSTEEQQYIKGFNHGYLLTKHLPDLSGKLTKHMPEMQNQYFDGFISGKEEYETERAQEHLNELDHLRRDTQERDLEKE